MDVNTLLLEDPVIKRYLQQYLDIHKLACLWMCFLELSLVFTQTQVKLSFGKLIIVQYVFRSCLKNKNSNDRHGLTAIVPIQESLISQEDL